MEVVFDCNNPKCVECGNTFIPKLRKQGGGTIRLYCSPRCRANSWARKNTAKRKISIIKYEAKPKSKEQKKERSLKSKFRKYGITETWFVNQLELQAYTCPGCLNNIGRYTARIDHNHATGKIRGLLCDHCNWAIGHVKDNKQSLRNLITYLEKHD